MDRDLVLRAQRGDREAFTLLVSPLLLRLRRMAWLIVRDRDLGDEAVQEALVAAWRYLPGLRDPERFEAWTNRLLVRSAYGVIRRNRRRAIRHVRLQDLSTDRDDDRLGPMELGPNVPDSNMTVALRDELERAFVLLTPEHRAAIVACHYLGMSSAEAAIVLDIPVGTLKSRLNRAMGAMRASLESNDRRIVTTKERTA